MGQQTGVVLAGFVVLHIALILNITSVVTDEWLEASNSIKNITNITATDNSTNSSSISNIGLWKKCDSDGCYSLMGTDQPAWFHAVQGLFVIGVILNFTSLFQDYIFLVAEKCKRSRFLQGSVTFDAALGACCLLCAIIVFGVMAPGDDMMDDMMESPSLSWSYWVAVAGTVALDLASLLQLRQVCLMRQDSPAYLDI